MELFSLLGLLIAIITSFFGRFIADRRSILQKQALIQSREALKKAQQEVRNKMVHDLAMNIEDRQARDLILKGFIINSFIYF